MGMGQIDKQNEEQVEKENKNHLQLYFIRIRIDLLVLIIIIKASRILLDTRQFILNITNQTQLESLHSSKKWLYTVRLNLCN